MRGPNQFQQVIFFTSGVPTLVSNDSRNVELNVSIDDVIVLEL